jgi:hypothetical protein
MAPITKEELREENKILEMLPGPQRGILICSGFFTCFQWLTLHF